MSLPESWSGALPAEARVALARAEAYVAARERAEVHVNPPAPLRYRALERVAPEQIKVVILGQDPYHGPGQAMGLAFSVPSGLRIPPSLRNVFKELNSDLGIPVPAVGDLTAWADQGVLLLNTSLSVEDGLPASHAKVGWEHLTDRLIAHASAQAPAAVFMLWGNHARAKAPLINASRHLVLQAAHPSPLSARKFLGCRHFSQANAFLTANGRRSVTWTIKEPAGLPPR